MRLIAGFLLCIIAEIFLCDGQSLCFTSIFKTVSNLCVALTLDGSIALALAPDQAVVWVLELKV